jgi:hypothetical protein
LCCRCKRVLRVEGVLSKSKLLKTLFLENVVPQIELKAFNE